MTNERFVSLDAARGVGAFSVVLWHWSHFFDMGVPSADVDLSARPFYGALYWLYNYGWMGVEFFFVLSGFIFFHYYYDSISDRFVGVGEFFKRRFARLYPLYGITLIIVILFQNLYADLHGTTFVYPPGGGADLLEAITLTSHWWPNQGFFFNGPSWSISVECFLYALFFVSARYSGAYRFWVFLALAVIGLRLDVMHWPIGRGMVSFFTGALVGLGVRGLTGSAWFGRAPGRVLLSALGVGLVLLLGLVALPSLLAVLGRIAPSTQALAGSTAGHLVVLVLFPYIVFVLALVETIRPFQARMLRLLGDCSYSIYLLHFPLQLVTVLGIDAAGLDRGIFHRPAVFVAWCALLFGVGALSYYGLEKPMQRRIRSLGVAMAARPSPTVS